MKELLLLCTKKFHYQFDGKAFSLTCNSVEMDLPLSLILAGVASDLTKYFCVRKIHIDNILCFVKMGPYDYILLALHGHYQNTCFICIREKNLHLY